MGDDNGSELASGGSQSAELPQNTHSPARSSIASPATAKPRGWVSSWQLQNPFSGMSVSAIEQYLSFNRNRQQEIADNIIVILQGSLESCDVQLHRPITDHNKKHHSNGNRGSEASCDHQSHKLLKLLQSVLDTKDAARLGKLFSKTTPLSESEQQEFRDLVLKAIRGKGAEDLPPVLRSIAGLLPNGNPLKLAVNSAAQSIEESANKSRHLFLAKNKGSVEVDFERDPQRGHAETRNLLGQAPSAGSPLKVYHPFVAFTPPSALRFEHFVGGEPLGPLSSALIHGAAWEQLMDKHRRCRDLDLCIRKVTQQISLARSPEERTRLLKERDAAVRELSTLRNDLGLPQTTIASLFFGTADHGVV